MTTLGQRTVGLTDVTNVGVNQRVKNGKALAPVTNESRKRKSEVKDKQNRPAPSLRYSFGDILHTVDEQNKDNELYCTEYSRSIFRVLKLKEDVYHANPHYMGSQREITPSMRATLNDWLVEVHLKFKLESDTLFLCINLVDRYLEKVQVSRNILQLVGVTCMLIASKYEEIYPPEISDFCEITDNAYTRDEVMNMELDILNRLEFNLTVTTPVVFLRRYLAIDGAAKNDLRWNVANFILELSLPEYSALKWCPSVIASAALYLTNRLHEVSGMRQAPSWEDAIEQYSGYSEKEIRECTKELLNSLCQQGSPSSSLTAVRRKYTKLNQGQVIFSAPIQKVLRSSQ
jgi:hypothetical protein